MAECNKQLSDTTSYIKQNKDTTNKVTKTVTTLLQLMKYNKHIDEETFTYLSPKKATCSRFYILPKIHKDRNNPPGRPIVSANGQPTEHKSEYVSDILNPRAPKRPSYIKDTTHCLNKLCSISAIPNDSLLVTLDVSSQQTHIKNSPNRNCWRPYRHYFDKKQF